jgi:hypothetical protein
MEDASPPKNEPIRIVWRESRDARYEVIVPFKPEYVVRPRGSLDIHFLPDHVIYVLGTSNIDYPLEEPPSSNMFQGEKITAATVKND